MRNPISALFSLVVWAGVLYLAALGVVTSPESIGLYGWSAIAHKGFAVLGILALPVATFWAIGRVLGIGRR